MGFRGKLSRGEGIIRTNSFLLPRKVITFFRLWKTGIPQSSCNDETHPATASSEETELTLSPVTEPSNPLRDVLRDLDRRLQPELHLLVSFRSKLPFIIFRLISRP